MFSIPEMKNVEDVMDINFNTINENESVKNAVSEIIKANKKTLVALNDDGDMSGIISITDIHNLGLNSEGIEDVKIKDIMKKNVVSVKKGMPIDECRNLMIKENIGILPVVDNFGKILGILRQEHIRDYLYMQLEEYGITLKYIIGHIKEGICAVNNEGVVILWNSFMEERYGIKSDDIVGRPISDFLEDTICERVLRRRIGISDVYSTYKKQDMYGLVHANPIFFGGEFVGVVCTELDVTEARNLSFELEKTNEKLKYLQDEVKNLSNGVFEGILGKSDKIEKAKAIAKQVAKTSSSIFIWGESGTGKEVFSRAIHEQSGRKGAFVPVNCSAIPAELFESEFFGYESGAFTGANKKGKSGIFELAKDGTVFLDEIADLPLNMQAKLLRVLQEKEVRRVGGEKTIKINPRIISATNKDLEKMVKEEKFREDLYYRLNVVEIKIPPLRERKEDIAILLHHFLDEMCRENGKPRLTLSKEAYKILENYRWKGNIRELKNTVENMVVLSDSSIIEKDDIPNYIVESAKNSNDDEDYPLDLTSAIEKLEIKNITKALEMSNGNKAKAAKILNIPRTTLYYKLDLYGIK
ncbi:sigma-54 dependent transcriptional regulator PrdR [Peptoclostridium sp. AF21-18]|uniref:sigma-54 dependent transcriptional regulator PrdR n=1 Tax=Peptoclostridium sp. AF21-18 TaxID=2292243 RepID=UPI000E474482|nr:sigma-54 dependent transcriptional regulator PrdR [Peptoclostridium sp. AF21-18]RHQ97397.1 CBS domain-containing protein [Peptoclostridium sp. AF21-18]